MRTFSKIAAVAVLVAATVTSCVKNEESEGVKGIRDAQAKLISAQADKVLAEVTEVLETVNGQKYDNQRKMWTLKTDSLAYEIKKSNDSVTISNLKRTAELAVIQQEIDMATRTSSLETAKASLEVALQTVMMQKTLDINNAQNTTLVGYITKLNSLLGTIQGLESSADSKDYDVAAAKNDVSNANQIISKQRSKEVETIRLKYKNLELADLIASQKKLSGLVIDPSSLTADLTAANAAHISAKEAYNAATLTLYKATEDANLKSTTLTNTTTVYNQISTLVNTTLGNITTANAGILSNSNSLTASKSTLAIQEITLKTNQELLKEWEAKLPSLLITYNNTNTTFQSEQTNLASKKAAYDLAVTVFNEESNLANQNALTAALNSYNAAIGTYDIADNTHKDAKAVYYMALTEVDKYKNLVKVNTQSISITNNDIAKYTSKIAEFTAKKAAEEVALAKYKVEQSAANATIEPAQTAYNTAQKVQTEASANQSYLNTRVTTELALVTSLRSLADSQTATNLSINTQIKTWEESTSSMRAQIEVLEETIANLNSDLADLAAAKIKSTEDIKNLESQAAGLRTQIAQYTTEMQRYQSLITALQTEIAK